MSDELYLILHKVRGEPAFDVAQIIGEDSDGEIWVIPTSGHRAYPYASWYLDELAVGSSDKKPIIALEGPMPDPWPDHYSVAKSEYAEKWVPKGIRKDALAKILAAIGHSKPSLIRRLPK